MPTYVYRYPRRRYGRRYSRYRRYGAYSRYRRRRSGTSSTASSRGRIRVRVPVQKVISCPVSSGKYDSSIITCHPWIQSDDATLSANPYGVCSAVSSALYRAYTRLYDQVKCEGVVSRISLVTAIGAGGLPAVQVVSAYDRMGNKNEVLNDADLAVGSLLNYSSAGIVSAINNSVAKTSRSCWASDIQERTIFHDCSLDVDEAGADVDADFNSNAAKVGYFSPLLLLGLRLAAAPSTDIAIQVLIEQTYYFTFRNPKYGGSSTSTLTTRSATAGVSGAPVMSQRRDARSLDSEADMGDIGGLDDENRVAAAPAASRPRPIQHDGEDPAEYLSPALQ